MSENYKNKILLIGSKGKSKIYVDIIKNQFPNSDIIIFDKSPTKNSYNKINSLIKLRKIIKNFKNFCVCIGNENNYARYVVSKKFEKKIEPLNVIHSSACINKNIKFGKGVSIMAMATIQIKVKIGDYSIVNTNAVVEHDCSLGNAVHVMSSATLCGKVQVGDFSTIGANATILPNLKIGRNVIVGAGSVVTKDVPDNEVVVGNPAKFLKKNEQEIFKYWDKFNF
jgi:sugar O-acyltransferase (sialic acid O-acetyltransferase NeuD family)